MDVMLQKRCAKFIYVVPEGLRELMTDISREVLRSQPENMYTFIADYLDALMITRENARVAARLIQNISEITTTTVEFMKHTGMVRSQVDSIVAIIQEAFKTHMSRPEESVSEEVEEANLVMYVMDKADIDPNLAEEAAKIIQHAFRMFKVRRQKEKELLSGMVDWRVAARTAIRLYRKTGVTVEEANRAATLIKAAYKGYYTRQVMKRIKGVSEKLHEAEEQAEIAAEVKSKRLSEVRKSITSEVLEPAKSVTIDYDTVIPHVDFDYEVNFEEGLSVAASTTSNVIKNALDHILNTTMTLVKVPDNIASATLASEPLILGANVDKTPSESVNNSFADSQHNNQEDETDNTEETD